MSLSLFLSFLVPSLQLPVAYLRLPPFCNRLYFIRLSQTFMTAQYCPSASIHIHHHRQSVFPHSRCPYLQSSYVSVASRVHPLFQQPMTHDPSVATTALHAAAERWSINAWAYLTPYWWSSNCQSPDVSVNRSTTTMRKHRPHSICFISNRKFMWNHSRLSFITITTRAALRKVTESESIWLLRHVVMTVVVVIIVALVVVVTIVTPTS